MGEGVRQRLLVPGFDLANHNPEAPSGLHGVADGQLYLKAGRDMEAGEELHINYGQLPNKHLVMWYGFVMEKDSTANITFEFPVLADAGEAFHAALQRRKMALPPQGGIEFRIPGT